MSQLSEQHLELSELLNIALSMRRNNCKAPLSRIEISKHLNWLSISKITPTRLKSMLKKILNKTMRGAFKKIPHKQQVALIRYFVAVPDMAFSSDFTVKVAETRIEYEAAYRLLYESYLKIGIIPEHSSGLRCTPFSVLPETSTAIVLYKNQVVGTVSRSEEHTSELQSR